MIISVKRPPLVIRSVIFKFETEEQADRLFGAFADHGIDDPEIESEVKRAVNTLMDYCGVYNISTKSDPEYGACFVTCN